MQRVGIVGCGFISGIHAFAISEVARLGLVDAEITATYDQDTGRTERLATAYGARSCATLDELLREVDVVWIATWTAAHLEAVVAAAAAGKAIFCEKPLGVDLADAEAVAAALSTVPHQVGLVLHHAPVYGEVARRISDGRHGAFMSAILRDEQSLPVEGMYRSTWRADAAISGGGTLIEHSIHDVDVFERMFGPALEVSARASSILGHEGIDDTVVAVFTYPSGAQATLTSVWHLVTGRDATRHLEVICERAIMWTDDAYLGPLHIETDDGIEVVELDGPAWMGDLSIDEMFSKGMAQYAVPALGFLRALEADPPGCGQPTADVALRAHRLVDAAYRSASSGGQPVTIE